MFEDFQFKKIYEDIQSKLRNPSVLIVLEGYMNNYITYYNLPRRLSDHLHLNIKLSKSSI